MKYNEHLINWTNTNILQEYYKYNRITLMWKTPVTGRWVHHCLDAPRQDWSRSSCCPLILAAVRNSRRPPWIIVVLLNLVLWCTLKQRGHRPDLMQQHFAETQEGIPSDGAFCSFERITCRGWNQLVFKIKSHNVFMLNVYGCTCTVYVYYVPSKCFQLPVAPMNWWAPKAPSLTCVIRSRERKVMAFFIK